MTRVSVYSAALVAFVAAMAMAVASIGTHDWVTYSVTTPKGDRFEKHIGLHRSCSSLASPPCSPYPPESLCLGGARYFCNMWRTAGFMASFGAILCLASLVTFAVVMRGGKYKRETGWPVVAGMLTLASAVEFAVVSIVAYLCDNDDQFTIPGWSLGLSWFLSLAAAIGFLLAAVGIAVSAFVLPPEEGYEFLEDPLDA